MPIAAEYLHTSKHLYVFNCMLHLNGLWYPHHHFLRSHFTSLFLNGIMFPLMAWQTQVHASSIWTSMRFNVVICRDSNNLLHSNFSTVIFAAFLHNVCTAYVEVPYADLRVTISETPSTGIGAKPPPNRSPRTLTKSYSPITASSP